MNKWFGKIGFVETVETEPGLWEPQIVEKEYYGEWLKVIHKWQTGSGINENLNVNNQISIVSDDYILGKLPQLRYIEYMGSLWKITSWEYEYPQIILTVGGEYNVEQT
jgi:hypothetical protein